MKTSARNCIENQLICRQYSEKWRFTNFNEVIKKVQCNHVLSFNSCPIPTDLQDSNDVPVSTCKFSNKHKDILAVANENGIVCIQNTKTVEALTYIQTHKNTVYDIAWMPGNSQFVTVSGDNSAKLWDCQESNINLISTFMGHKRSVRCVSFKPENTAVFATGSRDGSLMIWDARAWRKCAKFSHHVPDQVISSGAGLPGSTMKKNNISAETLNSRSVTGLVFQDDNTLISCGSMDKYIRVWDMRKTYSRSTTNTVAKHQFESPSVGFSYLSMNALGTKLYANCMDSYIYCFNINSYDPDPVAAFYGHTNGSFYVKSSVSLDGSYLLSGSSDEAAYIWNTKNAELSQNAIKPFIVLNSHTAEVTCVEMCSDNMVIITCSDDGTFRLWDPYMLKQGRDEKVDSAAYYDSDTVTAVKTQWKNKRKFKELDDLDSDYNKTSNYSSHTKICRFYYANHSSQCICQASVVEEKKGKRGNDEVSKEKDFARKRMAIEAMKMQERTPPRTNKHQPIVSSNCEVKVTPKPPSINPMRFCSKRKLEGTPGFAEGPKSKKINFGGLLTPLNLLENSKMTESKSPKECQNKIINNSVKELLQKTSVAETDEKIVLTALSSPTSNLPNYVEDGTSPYIHKCARVVQKENDWLTELRRKCKRPNTVETKPPSPAVVSPGLEKRKKIKQVDYTLHKYFKVSSKGVEKSFNAQEIQKRNILTKVEN